MPPTSIRRSELADDDTADQTAGHVPESEREPRLSHRVRVPRVHVLVPDHRPARFATILIDYVSDELCVELKSLKLYLWSFRDEGAFHEAVTNRICDDIVAAISPRSITVTGEFWAPRRHHDRRDGHRRKVDMMTPLLSFCLAVGCGSHYQTIQLINQTDRAILQIYVYPMGANDHGKRSARCRRAAPRRSTCPAAVSSSSP